MKTISIMSILSMIIWRQTIIMILISLEMLLMSAFTIISCFHLISSPMSLIIAVSIMVSGSSIGLSLLVALARAHNSSNTLPLWILSK